MDLDEAIQCLERRNENRALVELLAAKGSCCSRTNISALRGYHTRALNLAYSEFGKFHLRTAQAHGQFADSLMHYVEAYQYHGDQSVAKFEEWLEECHQHLTVQLEILDTLFGIDHPRTLKVCRVTADVLRNKLGRRAEASELQKKYLIYEDVC